MAGLVRPKPRYDLIILGGGHAGLQAGLKAGLLHQTAIILDRGAKYGRSYYAPAMDNIPGFPDGISGHRLLDLQLSQVRKVAAWTDHVAPVTLGEVRREGEEFAVTFERLRTRQTVRGRALLLALGVVDRMPEVGGKIDPIFPWANFGIVDYCMICDGHTLPGKSVAVLGAGPLAVNTALDLLHWGPASVTLLTHGSPLLPGVPEEESSPLLAALREHSIAVRTEEIVGFEGIREKRLGLRFADGSTAVFDKGFSALGWYTTHDDVARGLGARITPDGYVATDEDGRVLAESDGQVIPGLYAAGDQRDGWKQIPEAWAGAERAVIHAWAFYLSEKRPSGSVPGAPDR
jgi:thioredoxin reductase (NADPH)